MFDCFICPFPDSDLLWIWFLFRATMTVNRNPDQISFRDSDQNGSHFIRSNIVSKAQGNRFVICLPSYIIQKHFSSTRVRVSEWVCFCCWLSLCFDVFPSHRIYIYSFLDSVNTLSTIKLNGYRIIWHIINQIFSPCPWTRNPKPLNIKQGRQTNTWTHNFHVCEIVLLTSSCWWTKLISFTTQSYEYYSL